MIEGGLYDQSRFIVIYPAQNNKCAAAMNAYSTHLASDDPVLSGFQSVTFETWVWTHCVQSAMMKLLQHCTSVTWISAR